MAAHLYVTEYAGPAMVGTLPVECGGGPPIAEQQIAIGASSAASNAFDARTHYVRLQASVNCSIVFGAAPTALATSMRLAGNVPGEYFAVVPGQKVAVILNSD